MLNDLLLRNWNIKHRRCGGRDPSQCWECVNIKKRAALCISQFADSLRRASINIANFSPKATPDEDCYLK